MAAAVVAHGGADRLGQRVEVLDQLLDRLALQLGELLERGVEVVDVGLVVLAVMNLHRLRVDVRLERVERVRQGGEFVGHVSAPLAKRGPGSRPLPGPEPFDLIPSLAIAPPRLHSLRSSASAIDHALTLSHRHPRLRSRWPPPLVAHRRPRPRPTLLGFAAARAEAQQRSSGSFDASLDADNLRTWLKQLAARPHHVGSPYGKANAELMARLFTSWGYETAIEQYDVLLPTPTERVVELVAPTRFVASLSEPALKEDATSGQTAEQLPAYNAYSIDGDVTGELVYVNQGVPADYEQLERRGIDVRGKIVIARYGGSWRGIKPKVAAEHGAIGCLIYSDPREDGYFQGDAVSRRRLAQRARRAARVGRRHADLSRAIR